MGAPTDMHRSKLGDHHRSHCIYGLDELLIGGTACDASYPVAGRFPLGWSVAPGNGGVLCPEHAHHADQYRIPDLPIRHETEAVLDAPAAGE